MTVYRIDKEPFKNQARFKFSNKLFRFTGFLIAFGSVWLILAVIIDILTPSSKNLDFPMACGLMVFTAIASIVGGIKLSKFFNRKFNLSDKYLDVNLDFELEIEDNYITYSHFGELVLRLDKEEITEIKETVLGLVINPSTIFRSITFSKKLTDYEDAKAKLSTWVPIEKASIVDYFKIIGPFLPFFTLFMAGTVAIYSNMPFSYSLFPNSRFAITTGSLLLTLGLIVYILRLSRAEAMPKKLTRIFTFIMVGGLLITIIIRMCLELLNF